MLIIVITALIIIVAVCAIKLRNAAIARQIKKAAQEKWRKEADYQKLKTFMRRVETAQTLHELLLLHVQIWALGFQNKNLGPDQYGMFRTNDILMMTSNDVYLGNVCGLWTNTLSFWEKSDDAEAKTIVLNQYKSLLLNNLNTLQKALIV